MKRLACVAGLIALILAGCKAPPIETTPFFGTTRGMVQAPEIETFHQLWYRPDVNWNKYKKIQIPPVNTQYLREMDWWEQTSLAKRDDKGIKELAEFTRQEFVKAHLANKHKYRLEVVDVPDDQTVILELALTEVVPTKAWLNFASFAGAMMTLAKGSAAIEGRLRDGKTKEVIAKFADREYGKQNLIGNIKDFGWYGHARDIIRDWAKQTVEITNAPPGVMVKDTSWFEWKLW